MSGKAFDGYAANYDASFSFTGIGMAQRVLVWKYLNNLLSKDTSVLELSCGTGVDAFHFAPKVKSWQATDASKGMLEVCRSKQRASPLQSLHFECLDAANLENVSTATYDLVFSNFAGLNCLSPDQLSNFAQQSERVLAQNGTLALVFLGKKCLWENLYFWWKRDTRIRRRELSGGVRTDIDGIVFQTWYYSPEEIAQLFNNYTVTLCKGIGFFIPPSFMIRHFPEGSFRLRLLQQLEKLSSRFSALANYSDHFMIILEKKN